MNHRNLNLINSQLFFEETEEWLEAFLPHKSLGPPCPRMRIQLHVQSQDLEDTSHLGEDIKVRLFVSQVDRDEYKPCGLVRIRQDKNSQDNDQISLESFSLYEQNVLCFLKSIHNGSQRQFIQMTLPQFSFLLDQMREKSLLWFHDLKAAIEVHNTAPKFLFKLSRVSDQEIMIKAHVEHELLEFAVLQTHPRWIYDPVGKNLWPVPKGLKKEVYDLLEEARVMDEDLLASFFQYVAPELQKLGELSIDPDVPRALIHHKDPEKIRIYLDYKNDTIILELSAVFDDEELFFKNQSIHQLFQKKKQNEYVEYDIRLLVDAAILMRGTKLCIWDKESKMYISGDEAMYQFVYETLPRFYKDHSWESVRTDIFDNMFPDQIAIVPRIILQKKGAIDWFKFDVKYEAGKSTLEISKEAIHNALVCDKRYLRAKNGQYYPLDRKKIENLHSVIQDIHTDKSGRTSLWHLPFLVSEIDRDPSIQLTMDPELETIWGEIKNFRGIEKKTLPKEVNRVLRDYQKKGLDWLCFLRSFGFSGILADDMGLGKTLQVLSLLAKKKKNSGPSLVVCPTSLVWNWFEEIQKFLPSLKAVIIHGPSRHEQFEKIPRMDLAITSYALVKKDLDRHLQHHYRYVVLDEAQMIKNQDSLVAKAVKKLNARYRLALSGTPIENNLMELWSIFDFLMKGYLLSESAFRKKYERPITKDGCQEALGRLRRKIYPFVLRRVKEDVLDELPDKIEQTIHSELSPVQIQIYKKILKHYRSQIVETVHRRGFERSRITILTALLRLRQICCHPGLVDPALIDHNMHDDISGKFDALRDIVRKILQNKQKVLVFSQFTKMLNIMEEWIQKEGIMYTRLDGHTKNRQEVVQHFVDHVPTGVFLMSLKAGGLGLNLECANHVILYDPWWNPAVEEQAIDRAHRMGQKTVVHAYRLISLGTIEEKVRALQKKKEDLFDCVIKTNQDMVRSLSWEDVKLLFDL